MGREGGRSAQPDHRRLRTFGRRLLLLIVGAIIGAGVVWCGLQVFSPQTHVPKASPYTFVRVEQGQIGSTIALNTTAQWTAAPVASNGASGIITNLSISAGQELQSGVRLYDVNLLPVLAIDGSVPAFRALQSGDSGTDVQQLQTYLESAGYLEAAPTGRFDSATTAAVERWQRVLGIPATGSVPLGQVIFVPQLPRRVQLDPSVARVGASLSGGEPILQGLPSEPIFSVSVTSGQAQLMPVGTAVEITGPKDGHWTGYVQKQVTDPQTGISLTLTGKVDQPICGSSCTQIPLSGQTLLSSKVVTSPTIDGLVVPSSAILTTGASGTVVVTGAGRKVPVQVKGSAQGMSVVSGVAGGVKVRIPAGVQ